MTKKKRGMPLHVKILLGMIAGLIWGIVAVMQGFNVFTLNWVSPFGIIFMNLLQVVAIPMILTSLIVGITSLNDMQKLGRIGGRTIGTFVLTTIFAISIGLIAVNILKPGNALPENIKNSLLEEQKAVSDARQQTAEEIKSQGPLKPLMDLFPPNIIDAASNNKNMLQIVVLAMVFGVALIMIPREKSAPVIHLFDGLNEMVMKVVDLIMLIAPLGVFALMANVVVDLAGDDSSKILSLLKGLGLYGMTVLVGLLLHLVLVYLSIVYFIGKTNPIWFLKKMRPVQLLAFSTSSSNATLPLNIENAEKELGVEEEISGFVLPLGATINMDGTSLYQAVAAVFISQVFKMDLSFADQLTIVATATLASVGSAGVPGAGVVMLVIVLNSVGIPPQGIALVLGIDRILDMCRTAVNVTGDAAVAMAMSQLEGKIIRER